MLQERAAGLGRGHALAAAHEQRPPQGVLDVAKGRAGCGQRQMRALGTARDAARLDHVAKEAEIGQVEAHGFPMPARRDCLRIQRSKATLNTYCPPSPRASYSPLAKAAPPKRHGLPRAATLVTNESAREHGEEQWPKSRHPLSGRSLPISSSISRC